MTVPLVNEVDTVMQNYFAALNSKDEDIFRLYEDNKRMRTLVQDTLKAREDLETHSKSQALLIMSLKTELHEKKCLIEAQDDESSVLRESIAELRVLFNCPSELSFSPRDVILKVGEVVKEHGYLQSGLNAMNEHLKQSHQTALQNLVEEEARARRVLNDAAQLFFSSSILGLWRQQGETISSLESELAEQRRAAEEARVNFSEQLQLSAKRFELETTRSARREEEMLAALAAMEAHMPVMRLVLTEERERAEIARESVESLVREVWGPWAAVIERGRRQESVERQALERRAANLTSRLDSLNAAHTSAIEALENAQHAHQRQQKHVLKLEEKGRMLDACRSDLQELRLKHEKTVERLRKTHQQHQTATQTTAATLQAREKQLEEATKKSDRLAQQNAFLYRDVKTLEKRLDGHMKRGQTLETQCQQLRKEKQAEMCENEAKVLSMEHEIQQMRQEYEGRLTADKTAFQDQVKELKAERDDWKERWERSECDQTVQKKRFSTEIGEWAGLTEALKAQLLEARAQLERESTARKVLERSQRTESEFLSKLIANSSHNTSMATPERLVELTNGSHSLNPYPDVPVPVNAPVVKDGNTLSDELTRALESEKLLRHQVQVLERSCRRSTTVISELRETLYRERMERNNRQG